MLAPLFIVDQYRIDAAGTYKQDSAVATPDWLPSDALWISGPLASFHDQAMGDRCDACHRGLFNRVQDKSCLECHGAGTGSVGTAAIVDHVSLERMQLTKLEPTERCAVCHREHDEPALPRLVDDGDKGCVKCHGDSDALFGQIKLDQVKGFNAKRHPPFNAHLLKPKAIEPGSVKGVAMGASSIDRGIAPFDWVEEITATKGAKEQVNVKFSHKQHLDSERVYRPSADGNARLRQLPHGQPREVIFKLQEHFALKFGNPANFKATANLGSASPRRMPGQSSNVPVPEGERFDADRGEEGIRTCTSASFDCAQKVSRQEIDLQFTRRGCVSCHVVLDTAADNLLDRYQVYPIRFQRDYFPAARFPHKKHEIQGDLRGDEACLSCHAVKDSKESSDLLMPDVDKCEECHGDTPARQRVVTKCVACHEYHPRPVFSDGAVAPVPVKPNPGMTAGMRGSAALTQQGSDSLAAHTFAVAKHRQMFNAQRLNSLPEPLRSSLAKWRNSLDNVTTTSKTSARTVAQ
jgi:predicted CXXCH cytochrome family protein